LKRRLEKNDDIVANIIAVYVDVMETKQKEKIPYTLRTMKSLPIS